jgi:hypothetical protein
VPQDLALGVAGMTTWLHVDSMGNNTATSLLQGIIGVVMQDKIAAVRALFWSCCTFWWLTSYMAGVFLMCVANFPLLHPSDWKVTFQSR